MAGRWPDALNALKRAKTRMTAQSRNRVQGIVIPIALAGTLLTGFINLIGGAYWLGGLNARTTRNEADIKEERASIKEVTQLVRSLAQDREAENQAAFRQAVEHAAALKALEQRMEAQERQLALFRDETWGRISNLPYRDPKQR